jgi:glycosyltransferase involved in cell wall biosynthesis
MISVVISTRNAEEGLPRTLSCLVGAAADGLVRDVVIADGGSTDLTARIADAMGATLLQAGPNQGGRLAAGAAAAKCATLLFLEPGAELAEGWEREARAFVDQMGRTGETNRAATFRYALDSFSGKARLMETMVATRLALFGLPRGEQGLLIPRALYDAAGGHRAGDALPDLALSRRVGRRRLVTFRSAALSSPKALEQQGYLRAALSGGVDIARVVTRLA